MDEDRLAQLTTQVRALERRVEAAEGALLRLWCLAVAAVLVAGVALPYVTEERDGETTAWSVLSTPFAALAETPSGSEPGTEDVLFLVGFVGLLVVVAVMLVALALVSRRGGGRALLTLMWTLLVLAAVGTLVVLLLGSTATDSNAVAGGPGGWVLLAGCAAFASLLTEGGRRAWQPEPTLSPQTP